MLLDIDGTLIDSNDAHARAWVAAGAEQGHDIHFDTVRPLIGMGGDRVTPMVTGFGEESPEGERVVERRGEIFRERHLPGLVPTRGARALVERIKEEGIDIVIATSASKSDMNALLERIGVRDLIDDRTSSSDADSSKPAPDIVEAALELAGVGPRHAIMIGDTPYDVSAARNAGVDCIALRCGGGWSDGDFAGAVAIYDDPADLLANWESSPLATAVTTG
ncbi:MAG TPA: HAD family hydrolase [Longimicrobiales bacterium]